MCVVYGNNSTLEPIRWSDGLALFFNNEFNVTIFFESNRLIDIEDIVKDNKIRFNFCVWRSQKQRSYMGKSNPNRSNSYDTFVFCWGYILMN